MIFPVMCSCMGVGFKLTAIHTVQALPRCPPSMPITSLYGQKGSQLVTDKI